MINTKLDSFLLKTGFCSRVCASNKQELSLTPGVSFLFNQYSKQKTNDLLVESKSRT